MKLFSFLLAAVLVAGPATAGAIGQAQVDTLWILVAAALVLLMQVGFLLLESGLARTKNTINVAQKNIADLLMSMTAFGAIGYMVMFGPSLGAFGFDLEWTFFNPSDPSLAAFMVFQMMFCGTAATIVSGAIAERSSFSAYLVAVPIISIVIYPVAGHWGWGNLAIGDNPSWLADRGFVDFAGSTIVHSVGAWCALAALIVLGPRVGRYDDQGRVRPFQHHNVALATAGAIILFVGWLGFNAGSTLSVIDDIAPIALNTMVAGAVGGSTAIVVGHWMSKKFHPHAAINGLLGGLVAVTAGCAVLTPSGSAAIGALGGLTATIGMALMHRCKLDDVVGAVPVHGMAGAVGTIGLAILAPAEALPLNRISQTAVQAMGVGAVFLWVFPTSLLLFKLIDMTIGFRVSSEEEKMGLNAAEHGERIGLDVVTEGVAGLLSGETDVTARIEIEPGDEAADLAALFNKLLDQLEAESAAREFANKQAAMETEERAAKDRDARSRSAQELEAQAVIVAEIEALLEDASSGKMNSRLEVERLTGVFRTIGGGLNRLLDYTQTLSNVVATRAAALMDATHTQGNLVARVAEGTADQSQAVIEAGGFLRTVAEGVTQTREQLDITADLATKSVSLSADGKNATHLARGAVVEMDAAAQTIQTLIDEISAISQKTNLIAINAGVEASRSSDSKAFSVIASEIRSLAGTTGELATRASGILETTWDKINNCQSSITAADDVLESMSQITGETRSAMERVERFAEDQAKASDLMLDAMDRISRSTEICRDAGSDLSINFSEVADTAKTLGEALNHMDTASHSEQVTKAA